MGKFTDWFGGMLGINYIQDPRNPDLNISTDELKSKSESLDYSAVYINQNGEQPDNPMKSLFERTINPESNYTTTEVNNLTNFRYGNHQSSKDKTFGALLAELLDSTSTKIEFKRKIDSIKDIDYIEALIRSMEVDVLKKNWDPAQGPFFSFSIINEKYKKYEDNIRNDIENLGIYQWLTEHIRDILLYGQYIFKIDYTHDELDDFLDQVRTLPAYNRGDIKKVFTNIKINSDEIDTGTNPAFSVSGMPSVVTIPGGKYTGLNNSSEAPSGSNDMTADGSGTLYDAKEFFIFTLYAKYRETKVRSTNGSYYRIKIPEGVIPESIISKIVNLKMLEALQPLIELQALDEKMFFWVRFPVGQDYTEAMKTVSRYEQYIKSALAIGDVDPTDISSLLQKATTAKVIPLFGDQNQMESQTINKINRIDLSSLSDIRNGISAALDAKIDGDNSTYPRYLKKIRMIRQLLQDSASESLRGYIKVKYNIDLKPADFKLSVPEIYGAEELDTNEYRTLQMDSEKSTLDFVKTLAGEFKELHQTGIIDTTKLVSIYRPKLAKLLGIDILRVDEDLKKIYDDWTSEGEIEKTATMSETVQKIEENSKDMNNEEVDKDLEEFKEARNSEDENSADNKVDNNSDNSGTDEVLDHVLNPDTGEEVPVLNPETQIPSSPEPTIDFEDNPESPTNPKNPEENL